MREEMRFGVSTTQVDVTWEEMVKRWRYVETLGFDSVWLADHFAWFLTPHAPWYEAWTLLAGLATQTSRIRFGTLITVAAYRNPAFLARQALTIDHLSQGRLEIGLGAGVSGEIDPSFSMTDIEDRKTAERVVHFREVVEIVDQLLTNKVSSYEGHFFQLKDAAMQPQPIQRPRPPITIAAQRPKMLRIAARYADTSSRLFWGPGNLEERVEAVRQGNLLLDECCIKYGRDPVTLRRSLLSLPEGLQTAFGSVGAFEDEVERYMDAGINEFILPYPLNDKHLAVFERIATDAIPKLRS